MAKDVGETLIRVYDVSIDGADVGYCDEPEVTIEKELKEITLSQLHAQVMGHRLVGVKATAKLKLRQITKDNMALAFPWYGGTGDVPLMPVALGGDLYDHAKPVIFHPVDQGIGQSEDIVFSKAVITGPFAAKGDGEEDAMIELELTAYPDRAQLPNFVLGVIGGGAP